MNLKNDVWTGLNSLRIRSNGKFLEHGNISPDSMKAGNFSTS
jgi:hypothetical protein